MMRSASAVAAVSVLLINTAPAETLLSAATLHASCRAYSTARESADASVCANYVQGYLDSARLGVNVRTLPASDASVSETWVERATRTRLGTHSLEALRRRAHRFCVDETVAAPEIIERLLAYLHAHPPDRDTPAAEVLSATLRLNYSCEPL